MGVLGLFDGRPTRDILASLAEDGIELEEDLVLLLADFGVLVPSSQDLAAQRRALPTRPM